ncbi:MAG: nickel pincer cofactor biosynthesis protein LarB [Candidatus Omnitrophota bacterium]|nr:MAG: nickel pincer cofactor biosynthesis protein LarB [Candidatus Omnitrophota bacterium]
MAQFREKICELGFAKLDLDRENRRGFPEVIYSPGKTKAQLKKICRQMIKNKQALLLTKLEKNVFIYLKKSVPKLKYNPLAKIGFLSQIKSGKTKGLVALISAGTADIPVAEEAAVTLEFMGNRIRKLYDVGVAGVHRVMRHIELLRQAKVVIVVAGMEGALASLVSGLVKCPVVAVPTSCGYGANFKGLSALLTMLNSCSVGVAVVNIDNGFGAGYFASLINRGSN